MEFGSFKVIKCILCGMQLKMADYLNHQAYAITMGHTSMNLIKWPTIVCLRTKVILVKRNHSSFSMKENQACNRMLKTGLPCIIQRAVAVITLSGLQCHLRSRRLSPLLRFTRTTEMLRKRVFLLCQARPLNRPSIPSSYLLKRVAAVAEAHRGKWPGDVAMFWGFASLSLIIK